MEINTTKDLVPIARLGESLVIFAPKGVKLDDFLSVVQVNFYTKQYHVELLGRLFNFNPFEPIDIKNDKIVDSYVSKLDTSLPDEVVTEILRTYKY